MRLLGRANWWLPLWLDRLLPGEPIPSDHATPQAEPDRVAVSA